MSEQRRRNDELNMLSAYLDNELNAADRNWLEKRLSRELLLRERLENLRRTKITLGYLPRLKAPHNYTLTPAMVSVRRKQRKPMVSFLRLASSFAAILLVLLVGMELVLGNGIGVRSQPAAEAPAMEADSFTAEETYEPLIVWGDSQNGGISQETDASGGGTGIDQIEQSEIEEGIAPTEEFIEEEILSEEKVEVVPEEEESTILGLNPDEGGEIVARSEPEEQVRDVSATWQAALRWIEIALAVIAVGGGTLFWIIRNK